MHNTKNSTGKSGRLSLMSFRRQQPNLDSRQLPPQRQQHFGRHLRVLLPRLQQQALQGGWQSGALQQVQLARYQHSVCIKLQLFQACHALQARQQVPGGWHAGEEALSMEQLAPWCQHA
ncbi:hypothetical protein COHA_003192 [Chlorella ohadii]|uniref:Uncharacterized protein n=1 Tax=Chlorella ohadii TaxID=2649997 RepID=A0AAD5DVU5_9CHLO|nr:hypothetical protein COHA_003192 [Chlorella ohadii]